jgi:pimeloyl-ACP methyl ester carboxylesterase
MAGIAVLLKHHSRRVSSLPAEPLEAIVDDVTHCPAAFQLLAKSLLLPGFRLDGLGHIPMFEAPGRIIEVITDFLEQHSTPIRAADPPAS